MTSPLTYAAVYRRPHEWAHRAADSVTRGLKAHGMSVVVTERDELIPSGLVVMWSINWPVVIRECERVGRPYLVLEAGYLGERLNEVSCGWNGLKRRGVLPVPRPDRWADRYRDALHPWRTTDGPVVLMGQHPNDAAVRALGYHAWLESTRRDLLALGHDLMYRPHPKIDAPDRPLSDVLRDARAVVTLNSNTGVDAVVAGVPTVACDAGSMAWPVASHGVASIAEDEPDREAWGAELAGCQWSLDEIASGEAIEHVMLSHGVAHERLCA